MFETNKLLKSRSQRISSVQTIECWYVIRYIQQISKHNIQENKKRTNIIAYRRFFLPPILVIRRTCNPSCPKDSSGRLVKDLVTTKKGRDVFSSSCQRSH